MSGVLTITPSEAVVIRHVTTEVLEVDATYLPGGSAPLGRSGMPGPLAFGAVLTRYRDVFRLAGVPDWMTRPILAGLGILGRARGY